MVFNKMINIPHVFALIFSAFLLTACGGVGGEDRSQFDGSNSNPDNPTSPPDSGTPTTQTFQLQVSISGNADSVQFTWMRQAINEAPGFNGTFSATGETFEEPVAPTASNVACTESLTRETDTLYLYQLTCNTTDNTPTDPNPTTTTITTNGALAYPVRLRIDQLLRTLQNGVLELSDVDATPEIVGVDGPQTCELNGSSPTFTLACDPFTAGFGGINSNEQQLYLAYDNRDVPVTSWDETDMGQVTSGYYWVDSMLWLQTSTNRVYSIDFSDGTAGEPVLRASDVVAMTSLEERILIMQQPDNNQQRFVRYQDGALSQSTPYPNHVAVSFAENADSFNDPFNVPFNITPRRISWLVRENGSEQFKLASFINVFTDLKTLPASINRTSGLPVFNYDDANILVSFDENQAKFSLADSSETELALNDIDDFTSATVWRNTTGNEFLFHTRENAIAQQFTRTIDNESTSAGFNTAQLEQIIVDWVGGDGELFIAGERIDEGNDNDTSNDTLGKLTYLRFGAIEFTEAQLQNRLDVTTDIRVQLTTISNTSDPLRAALTSVNTHQEHLLVYTGSDTAGTIWLLAGNTAHEVKNNATITEFSDASRIVNTTAHQAIVQESAERIIVVVK